MPRNATLRVRDGTLALGAIEIANGEGSDASLLLEEPGSSLNVLRPSHWQIGTGYPDIGSGNLVVANWAAIVQPPLGAAVELLIGGCGIGHVRLSGPHASLIDTSYVNVGQAFGDGIGTLQLEEGATMNMAGLAAHIGNAGS